MEFGEFALVYAALLFANIAPNTLLIQPFSVLFPAQKAGSRPAFFTGTAIAQSLIVLFELLLAMGCAVVAYRLDWHCAPLLLALGPAVAAWQIQEFVRRAFFVENRISDALANDLISYGGQAAAMIALYFSNTLTGVTALCVLTFTSLAAALFGAWQLRGNFARRFDRQAFWKNVALGKWLTGAALLQWCSSLDMYSFLAAWMLGATVAGQFRVAILVFGPARVLSLPIGNLLPIRFARAKKAGGESALDSEIHRALVLVSVVLGGYCLLATLAARPLLSLFGSGYESHPAVLAFYAITSFLIYLQMVWGAALTARHDTRPLFINSVFGAAFSLATGWALILTLGIYGALAGFLLTNIGVTLMIWRSNLQSKNRMSAEAESPGDAFFKAREVAIDIEESEAALQLQGVGPT